MNDFTTVFDLTAKSVKADALYHLVASIVLITGGISGIIFHKWVIKKLQIRIARSIFFIMVLLGLWWRLEHMDIFNYVILDNAKNARLVEGTVHVSHTQPYQGHTSGDKISIDDQPFEVDYFSGAPGYKETITHGGALKEGVYARIYHCDGTIIKVEVRK